MFTGDLKSGGVEERNNSDFDHNDDDYVTAAYIRSITGIKTQEAVKSILALGVTRKELQMALRHCRAPRIWGRRHRLMTGRILRLYRIITQYHGGSV